MFSPGLRYNKSRFLTIFILLMRKNFGLLFITSLILTGCQKQIDLPNGVPNGGGAVPTQVTTTLKVLVLNQDGIIVSRAKVQSGNTVVYSNEFGYAEIRNIQVPANKAAVKVSAPGYFDAYRTFAADNNECFGKVKLLPYKLAGTIASSSGGTVNIGSEVSISFPSNAFMYENGTDYQGNAKIYGAYLNPEAEDFNLIMPGDLVGEDNGDVVLRSFGMTNVEIQDGASQSLKLKPNVKATIKAIIPPSLISAAPSSIPMWYFDTKKGVWIREGSGTKQGNTYVGDVSHFTPWNYDAAFPRIFISGKVKGLSGSPLVNTLVSLTINSAGITMYAFTNSDGFFRFPAPPNMGCTISLKSSGCNLPFYNLPFNTGSTDLNLGIITATPASPSWFQLSAAFQSCSNQPVQSGSLKVYAQNNMFEGQITNGAAAISFSFCNDSVDVLLVAEDFSTGKLYTGTKRLYKNVAVNMGTQSICVTPSEKYIRYIVDNQIYYIQGNSVDSLTSHYFGSPPPWVQVAHNNWSTFPLTSKIYFNTYVYGSVTTLIIKDYPNLSNFGTNIQLTNVFENYSSVPGTINKGKVSGRMFDTGIGQWRYIDIAYSVMQK